MPLHPGVRGFRAAQQLRKNVEDIALDRLGMRCLRRVERRPHRGVTLGLAAERMQAAAAPRVFSVCMTSPHERQGGKISISKD